jgi:hypothetical protein
VALVVAAVPIAAIRRALEFLGKATTAALVLLVQAEVAVARIKPELTL